MKATNTKKRKIEKKEESMIFLDDRSENGWIVVLLWVSGQEGDRKWGPGCGFS